MMWSSADCFFLQSLVWIVISLQQVSVGNALGNERMPASSQYSVFSSFSEEEKTTSGFSRIHQLANKAQELVNNKQQSQSQQQHQQQHLLFRTLQEEDSSTTTTTTTTIDFVCNTLLNSTFATEYERDNANCACDYEGNDSGTTNPTDGIYVLTCRYDYCQECIIVVVDDTDTDTDTDICGVQVNQNIISVVSPNVYFLAGSYCVELTSSNTNRTYNNGMMMMPTTTCFDFSLDPTDVGMTTTSTQCRVTVGDEECNSCDFVDCNGTALAEFDCLNIGNTGGGIQASLCNLDNSNFPINSPFSVFRDDIYSFDSCISSDTAASIPEPTISPTITTITMTTTTLPTTTTSNMPTTNTTSNMPTTTSVSSSSTTETLTSSTSTTSLAPTTTSSSILSVVVDTTDSNRTTTTADEPTAAPTNSFTIQEEQQQQAEAEAEAAAASPSPTEVKRSSASSSSSSSSSFKQSSVTPWTFSLSIMTVLTATFIV